MSQWFRSTGDGEWQRISGGELIISVCQNHCGLNYRMRLFYLTCKGRIIARWGLS